MRIVGPGNFPDPGFLSPARRFLEAPVLDHSWSKGPGPRGAAAQRLDCDMFEQINKKVHENKKSRQKTTPGFQRIKHPPGVTDCAGIAGARKISPTWKAVGESTMDLSQMRVGSSPTRNDDRVQSRHP